MPKGRRTRVKRKTNKTTSGNTGRHTITQSSSNSDPDNSSILSTSTNNNSTAPPDMESTERTEQSTSKHSSDTNTNTQTPTHSYTARVDFQFHRLPDNSKWLVDTNKGPTNQQTNQPNGEDSSTNISNVVIVQAQVGVRSLPPLQ